MYPHRLVPGDCEPALKGHVLREKPAENRAVYESTPKGKGVVPTAPRYIVKAAEFCTKHTRAPRLAVRRLVVGEHSRASSPTPGVTTAPGTMTYTHGCCRRSSEPRRVNLRPSVPVRVGMYNALRPVLMCAVAWAAVRAAAAPPPEAHVAPAFCTAATADATDVCGGVCDGRSCGTLPCGIRSFYGTVLGDAVCDIDSCGSCGCNLLECDSCGNGYVEGAEECDRGGTCAGGPAAGMPCTLYYCPGSWCQPRGGSGCAENCTYETRVTANVRQVAYPLQLGTQMILVPLAGSITFAEGKPKTPPPPPCRPAAVRRFTPAPSSVPGIGCVCVHGTENALAYGPGNVGAGVVGCADAPNRLRADLTLAVWVLPEGCEPGQPDDGADGQPCTDDDPARQNASIIQADFACAGDCDGNGIVMIDELMRAASFALSGTPPYPCPSLVRSGSPAVSVEGIVAAAANAVGGCRVLTLE